MAFYKDASTYNPLFNQAAAASARGNQYTVAAAEAFKPGDILNQYVTNRREQEKVDAQLKQQEFANKLAQERIELSKQAAQEASKQRELVNRRYDTKEASAQATNQALMATLNPEAYGSSKVAGEQAAIERSILALPEAERAGVRDQVMKNYDPTDSKTSWLEYATSRSGIDAKTIRDAKNADYRTKVSMPGTPEYEAANKANTANQLSLFREKKRIEQQYKPKPKEANIPMFIKKADGSLVSMNVPQSQVKGMYDSGWQAGNWSKGSMKDTKSEDAKLFSKTEAELNETIGLLGNASDLKKTWSKAKAKGMHPGTFLNIIKSQGGTTSPDFFSLDVGKRDIDTSVVDKWLEGRKTGSSATPTTILPNKEVTDPIVSPAVTPAPTATSLLGKNPAPSKENIAIANKAIESAKSNDTEAVVKQFATEMSKSGFAPMSESSKEQWKTLGYILNVPFEVLRDIGKKYGPAG